MQRIIWDGFEEKRGKGVIRVVKREVENDILELDDCLEVVVVAVVVDSGNAGFAGACGGYSTPGVLQAEMTNCICSSDALLDSEDVDELDSVLLSVLDHCPSVGKYEGFVDRPEAAMSESAMVSLCVLKRWYLGFSNLVGFLSYSIIKLV